MPINVTHVKKNPKVDQISGHADTERPTRYSGRSATTKSKKFSLSSCSGVRKMPDFCLEG